MHLLLHAGKCQNLFHEVPGPQSGIVNGLQFRIEGMEPVVQILQSKFRIPQHGTENIVEVVGNSTGQGTQGLHFLNLP